MFDCWTLDSVGDIVEMKNSRVNQ